MLVMISHTEIMPAHLFHMTGKAASRLEGKYLMAKLKINTFKAFSDIRTELQRDNVVKYLLIFSNDQSVLSVATTSRVLSHPG